MDRLKADEVIKILQLEPLEFEGGYYRRNYLSGDQITNNALPLRYAHYDLKHVCSAIYYLLTADSWSRIHRLPTDEIFHFYLGDPVEIFCFGNNRIIEKIKLGNDLTNGFRPQVMIPALTWQASRLIAGGEYALLGTTMAPAFDELDFERPQQLKEFLRHFPDVDHPVITELW